jgi:hypothetical protein
VVLGMELRMHSLKARSHIPLHSLLGTPLQTIQVINQTHAKPPKSSFKLTANHPSRR